MLVGPNFVLRGQPPTLWLAYRAPRKTYISPKNSIGKRFDRSAEETQRQAAAAGATTSLAAPHFSQKGKSECRVALQEAHFS